ncbi:NOC2 family protein [Cryptosporidium andersoni]|uniref:NOC2 family protein n=1 Tax=Cryptosporidium andersoni TaxID=117008 RepID=A0A1J4MND7_9CRYT|nr:NOC2 family protein [Cryptosporidium andersoni]
MDKEIIDDFDKHLCELEQLKELDPEFHKYLEENHKELLNPTFEEEQDEEHDIDKDLNENNRTIILSKDRFEIIKADTLSRKSFHGFSVLISCFRSVANLNTITKYEEWESENNLSNNEVNKTKGELPSEKKFKSKKRRLEDAVQTNEIQEKFKLESKQVTSNFQIEDPELMVEIIEVIISNIADLLLYHASKTVKTSEIHFNNELQNIAVHKLARWRRVEGLNRIFWQDTYSLILKQCVNPEINIDLMSKILHELSKFNLLRWLLPNKSQTLNFANILSRIWTMNKHLVLRSESFTVLKSINYLLQNPQFSEFEFKQYRRGFRIYEEKEAQTIAIARHEQFLMSLYRVIGITTLRGVSWKNFKAVNQAIEDFVLLLCNSEVNQVYRFAYSSIRHLGLSIRILFLKLSRMKKLEKKPKRKLVEEAIPSVYNWKFIFYSKIWIKAIGQITDLNPLVYPLTTLLTAAIKIKTMSITFLPFCLHCCMGLVELSKNSKTFIPLFNTLFELHQVLAKSSIQTRSTFKKDISKQTRKSKPSSSALRTSNKPYCVEFEFKISSNQQKYEQVIHEVQEYWIYILTYHLTTVALNPAFPEFSFLILSNLRKLIKNQSRHWSEESLKNAKQLVLVTEETCEVIRSKRIQLSLNTDINYYSNASSKQFLDSSSLSFEVFEYRDNPLIRHFETLSSQRALSIIKRIEIFTTKTKSLPITIGNEDIEMKTLLAELNKVGKSVQDLKYMGPRQLKKLKQKIRGSIDKSLETITSQTQNCVVPINTTLNFNKKSMFIQDTSVVQSQFLKLSPSFIGGDNYPVIKDDQPISTSKFKGECNQFSLDNNYPISVLKTNFQCADTVEYLYFSSDEN